MIQHHGFFCDTEQLRQNAMKHDMCALQRVFTQLNMIQKHKQNKQTNKLED